MATKRTRTTRTRNPDELAAWAMTFRAGFDFFGTAAAFCGLTEPSHVWPLADRPKAEKAWLAAAKAAWRRVGTDFLATASAEDKAECWGLVQFGRPPGAKGS